MINTIGKSDIGMVRTTNQDAYHIGKIGDDIAWAVVCDGMGGASGGNVASLVAVGAISDNVNKNYNVTMRENSLKNMLVSAITNANVLVNQKSHQNPELSGMGTTVVLSFIKDGVAHIAHAGDSRAYLISNSRISQITRDHTMVQYLIETGEITLEEAKNHPKKHLITRALGVAEEIDVDYNFVSLEKGDKILMCTDGLTNLLESDEICEVINENTIEKATDILVDTANERGGMDNITVVIMECV